MKNLPALPVLFAPCVINSASSFLTEVKFHGARARNKTSVEPVSRFLRNQTHTERERERGKKGRNQNQIFLSFFTQEASTISVISRTIKAPRRIYYTWHDAFHDAFSFTLFPPEYSHARPSSNFTVYASKIACAIFIVLRI